MDKRSPPDKRQLIYDWNLTGSPPSYNRLIEFDDETLRDGLQSPSVTQPSIEDKIRLLHLMVDLGIQGADIGLPGAGGRTAQDVIALSKEIANQRLPIAPNCAARTLAADIDPIVEASQRSGLPIEAALFIGSSPIREYVEDWTLDFMRKCTEESVTYAIKNGLRVMFVTEDTTRARPEVLRALYTSAINCGARRICISDTVGHSNPHGAHMLVTFLREVVAETGEDVKIDWHGHRDRAFDVSNAMAAAEAGADRVHGTGLGVGERCGNVAMEHLLVNFKLLGVIENDLTKLPAYCGLVSEALGVPIPFNHPVMGADAFRTSTGVHAAAVIKAIKKKDDWLVNRVYSGVPADWMGRAQQIEIGPMSGASNVIYWLQSHGIEPTEALVATIFEKAKGHNRVMTDDEIHGIVKQGAPARVRATAGVAGEKSRRPAPTHGLAPDGVSDPPPAIKKHVLHVTVNGVDHELFVPPNRVLLEVLREDLRLTGTKFGCELGECGVCTVLIDGVPKLSCITLATLCEGAQVTTVEGLKGEELETVAGAFSEQGASQCGYCTPSMAIMLKHLLDKEGEIDIRHELSGNICRCTGFAGIVRAYEKSLERKR